MQSLKVGEVEIIHRNIQNEIKFLVDLLENDSISQESKEEINLTIQFILKSYREPYVILPTNEGVII